MIDTGRLIHRAVDVEAGLTQIRVHELASELSVSTQQVVAFVEELGKKVRGPSTVIGVSIAAKVRNRFRAARGADAATPAPAAAGRDAAARNATTAKNTATPDEAATPAKATSAKTATSTPMATKVAATAPAAPAPRQSVGSGQSLFLPPVAPAAAAAFSAGPVAFANPFAVPEARPSPLAVPPVPLPEHSAAQRVPPAAQPPVADPVQDFDDAWRHRGFDRDEQELWCSNGIRPRDAALADQCRVIGIAPEDLPRKLSGRTVLQRLRDGESTTSVWARIQEADQAPRRAGTKLTGRFQLS